MNAAINQNRRPSLYPVGQSDQEQINAMKLGKAPLRALAQRPSYRVPTSHRRDFSTVWSSPVYAATA